MSPLFFDQLVQILIEALRGGFTALSRYTIPILAFCALVSYCTTLWPVILSGGDGLSALLLTVTRIGLWHFVCLSLGALSLAALDTMLLWGAAPAGGVFTGESFLTPSGIIEAGARAAYPLQEFVAKHDGWMTVLANLPDLVVYTAATWIVLLAFLYTALHVSFILVELHFSIMVSAVMLPWGVLAVTSFLAEFCLSWLVSSLVRVLCSVALMSVTIPVFNGTGVAFSPTGDPDLFSAGLLAGASVAFALLAWVLPGRAAALAGRSLALGGDLLLPHGGLRAMAAGGRALVGGGGHAIQGVSRMMQARRGGG